MAGRPRKKPEYNPELQFNNFLQELRDAYEEADSLRSLADELNISLLKLRKLLITADVFTSDGKYHPCLGYCIAKILKEVKEHRNTG